jgi:hypothetical protein
MAYRVSSTLRAMAVDRLLADHQMVGDLLARVALRDELDDLEFARRQGILRRSFPAAGAIEVVAYQRRHRGRIDEGLAAHRRAARFHEIAVARGLQDVARCSCLQRLEEVLLVVVHGEHEDAQLRPLPAELLRGL